MPKIKELCRNRVLFDVIIAMANLRDQNWNTLRQGLEQLSKKLEEIDY